MIKRLQIAGKNGYRRREFQKNAFLYLMALPAVLYLFINNYLPYHASGACLSVH